MSFGRKGLGPGNSVAGQPRATRPAADDDIARKREAFLAAERARRAEEHGDGGISGVAGHYRSPDIKRERNLWMAYLLWFILGQISAHRFYLGAYRSAMAQVGLFAVAVIIAISRASSGNYAVGAIMAIAMIGWAVWILGDVFFIHRIHRKLCRKPGEAAAAAAVFA